MNEKVDILKGKQRQDMILFRIEDRNVNIIAETRLFPLGTITHEECKLWTIVINVVISNINVLKIKGSRTIWFFFVKNISKNCIEYSRFIFKDGLNTISTNHCIDKDDSSAYIEGEVKTYDKMNIETKTLARKLLLLPFALIIVIEIRAQIPKYYSLYEIKDKKIEKCVNDLMYQAEEYIKDGGTGESLFKYPLKKEDVKFGLSIQSTNTNNLYWIFLSALNKLRRDKESPSFYGGCMNIGDNPVFYNQDEEIGDKFVVKTETWQPMYHTRIPTMGVHFNVLYDYERDLIIIKKVGTEGSMHLDTSYIPPYKKRLYRSVETLREEQVPFLEITDTSFQRDIAFTLEQIKELTEEAEEENTMFYMHMENRRKNLLDIYLTSYYKSIKSMVDLDPDGVIILGHDTIFYEGNMSNDILKLSDKEEKFKFNPYKIAQKGVKTKEIEYDRYFMGAYLQYNPLKFFIYQKYFYFGEWYYMPMED